MLLRPFSLVLALILTACGGGNHSAPSAVSVLQQSADGAVSQGLAGVVLAHLDPGHMTQARAGLRELGGTVPIQAGDAFLIGSTTKAMTAALAGRLVEQGRIAWTTTLAEALPDLAAGMQPAYRAVTLEQLLSHRGGLMAFNNGDDVARFEGFLQSTPGPLPTSLPARERFFAAWLLAQEPIATPGQGFAYSNAGYALAALMLEARTGRAYVELFEQELARPLGLSVSWTSADTRLTGRPIGHQGPKGKLAPVTPADADAAVWLDVLRPGGEGTTTTPDSYATWVDWHLRALRGEATPLAAGYLQRIRALKPGEYGLGWIATDVDGRAVIAHDGEYRGFCSLLVIDARGRSASFAFTNTAADDGLWTLTLLNQTLLDVERALPPAP
ncbi:serine hydrolase domain-containing protein [Roseateles puraquae]|uniref:Serine hydrolase n=1 Tax=Roseateles puraquae TaxID=431059 RepID=A0A254N6P9_9BURK|nr:serine hydrolase domain-containing protein [Roseateles puraquae]MDG0853209.1 class A beta-lactamase-related serine hydrolase [Roseateles puraquae]OWR03716.1 serine hydrolase [Roseateles puraquae]